MATQLAGWSSLSCSCPPSPTINVNNNKRSTGGGRLVSVKAGEAGGQTKKLLCLSNGHGEDEVAVSVLKEIICMERSKVVVEAIPLVGIGHAYKRSGISTIGPSRNMPSGGFINTDILNLLWDIHAGLFSLFVLQWKTVENWVKENPGGILLAVGDVFPLLLTWMASRQTRKVFKQFCTGNGVKFIFIGTAKSEYYLQDDDGVPHKLGFFKNLDKYLFPTSVYLPWERAMMADSSCCLVVPRDSFTATTLKKALPVSAKAKIKYLGNPMMDNLKPSGALDFLKKCIPALFVALFPGSRVPEVYFNWQTILDAVDNLLRTPISNQMIFLVPIVPYLEIDSFSKTLLDMGWKFAAPKRILHDAKDFVFSVENIIATGTSCNGKNDILHSISYKKDNSFVLLIRGLFPDVASWADAGIAMAGTATEQLVGLGKPVFTMAGNGPQFTNDFAKAQSRLLGKSASDWFHDSPDKTFKTIQDLLHDFLRLFGRSQQEVHDELVDIFMETWRKKNLSYIETISSNSEVDIPSNPIEEFNETVQNIQPSQEEPWGTENELSLAIEDQLEIMEDDFTENYIYSDPHGLELDSEKDKEVHVGISDESIDEPVIYFDEVKELEFEKVEYPDDLSSHPPPDEPVYLKNDFENIKENSMKVPVVCSSSVFQPEDKLMQNYVEMEGTFSLSMSYHYEYWLASHIDSHVQQSIQILQGLSYSSVWLKGRRMLLLDWFFLIKFS